MGADVRLGVYMSEGVTPLRLAEELHAARHNIESSVIYLRSSIQGVSKDLESALEELEEHGMSASLASLEDFSEKAQQIEKMAGKLRKQKDLIEQAIGHIRQVQTVR